MEHVLRVALFRRGSRAGQETFSIGHFWGGASDLEAPLPAVECLLLRVYPLQGRLRNPLPTCSSLSIGSF